ncbi:MAG: enoyl-CoA hydratase/isomerase family protein [Ignavibacteriae bacterium]|nr:enoyl-CoA hydratase/isomerase family protein [Ignavibacteriota bacterium]
MKYKNILVDFESDLAIITINRPEKLNALNNEVFNELENVFDQLKKDKTNVVIITGAGDKAFVAGADIKELNKCDEKTGKDFSLKGQNVFNKIENLGKPVIAAINGFALGGGCELALACHIRIANSRAKFGQPEVNLGIIPGYGGTQRLARLINTGRAAEYILTGDLFDAEDALRIGFVNKITAPEDLIDEAKSLAKKISAKGQIAVRAALGAILQTNDSNLNDGLNYETELFASCCKTNDFVEGTTAFLEKRSPKFKNR